ncbi:histidine ammonia-lyase [Actinoallomurus vinaceus]|uniref:Histidine ammonia-lyase n=1 Tax=Actinoallomurus vinaceus TaxID=1080074 RepID=A0ABP8U896_9ACTN
MARRALVAVLASAMVVGTGQVAAAEPVRPDAPVRLVLDGSHLTVRDAYDVLDGRPVDVRLAGSAVAAMRRSRAGAIAALAKGARVYGWNQALGPLKDRPLDDRQQRRFQLNVLLSHAAGVGPALPDRVARLALILKANQMARGDEGVRPELPQRLLDLVNAGIAPVMPQIGSLGTGDLQPQAAAGLVAIGGPAPARYRGTEAPAARILAMAGLRRDFEFQQGEALPMISGSTVVAALFLDVMHRAEALADVAEGTFALFLEATRAEQSALDPRTHDERHIPEQSAIAARLRTLIRGTQWMTDRGRAQLDTALGQQPHPRVQDSVAVRAAPHIMAVLRRDLAADTVIVEREANSSTSNPLVFPTAGGYEFVMGGNWDGAMMGHAADSLNADLADLGVLSQELSGRLLSPRWSYGLPANLAGGEVGLNSGMVQVQTVAAALVPEMQAGAFPAGVLSRPVKDGQEDHNTMAMASVRHTDANVDRLATILAVQYLMTTQGIDLIRDKMAGLPLGQGTQALHDAVRRRVPKLIDDRWMSPDLQAATDMVNNGELRDAVRHAESTTSTSGKSA